MWATLADAHLHWIDSASLTDQMVNECLDAAYESVYAYAPKFIDKVVLSCSTSTTSALVTTATAGSFTATDVGRGVTGTGMPANAKVIAVHSGTEMVISGNATATGTADLLIAGVPMSYVIAHVYQAREIAAAALRGEQDVIGIGDYAIRARPLTASVKQLLRPATRVPVIG